MKVLVVDDTPSAVRLLIDTLATEPCDVLTATSGTEALDVAARELPDVVLLDVMLPGMSGFDVCQELRRQPGLADITVIMLTALDDRRARLSAFSAGADDFLSKPFDRVELRLRLRGIARLNRFRRLLDQQHAYEDLARLSPDGILSLDQQGTVLFGNPSAAALAGSAAGQPVASLFHADDQARVEDGFRHVMTGREGSHRFTARLAPQDGRTIDVECTFGRVAIITGPQRASLIIRDISERQALESRVDRLERSELVAETSAEIAHDTSNMMLGAQLAIFHAGLEVGASHPAQVHLKTAGDMIEKAGQLLHAFSRFDREAPEADAASVDLNDEVLESEPLLRVLARDAALDLQLTPQPMPVAVAPAALHQVLSNLVTNARDAMDETGRIVIRTYVEAASTPDATVPAWHFVEVADTGCGMSEEVLRRVFDQYFTTKGDRGTGLGLPSVHRVVARHGGTIRIDSQVGAGSTFRIGFPATQSVAAFAR